MKVGLIGVGLMGHGIARNVLGRGAMELNFLDHPGNQPVEEILSLGGVPYASPAEVAAVSDVVILCVTGSPQVEAILTGPAGVISALRPGAVVVDCSTALPDSTLRMGKLVQAAGGHFLDAPMTRTAKHAHEGTLNLLVGGDVDVLAKVRGVLASFTEAIEHVGALGNGHRMKLLHNYVSVGFMTLLAEAAAQAADGGVDPSRFVEVLASGGGASVALDRMAPFLTEGNREVLPFFVSNALKDIDYYCTMSEQAGARKPIADGIRTAISGAVEAGYGRHYLPELARIFRKSSAG